MIARPLVSRFYGKRMLMGVNVSNLHLMQEQQFWGNL